MELASVGLPAGTLDVMELQKALALGGLNFSLKTVQAMMRLHDKDGALRVGPHLGCVACG